MHSLCPKCEQKLSQFAFECDRCDWQLIGTQDTQQEALDQQLSDADLHLHKAKDSIGFERYEEALVSVNRAIAAGVPDTLAESHRLRGYCYLKLGDFAKSEAECTTSLKYEWDDVQTLAWRAASRGEQNKWRLAFSDLAKACELAGDARDPYLNLIETYKKTAGSYFTKQIQAGDQTAEQFNERGWVYLKAQDFKKARRDFQLALEKDPTHPWANHGMASTLFADEKTFSKNSLAPILAHCKQAFEGPKQCKI